MKIKWMAILLLGILVLTLSIQFLPQISLHPTRPPITRKLVPGVQRTTAPTKPPAPRPEKPGLCVLVRTFKEHYPHTLPILVLSIIHSWRTERTYFATPKFFIIVTDPKTSLEETNDRILNLRTIPDALIFQTTYQPGSPQTDYGYPNTNSALQEILNSTHTCNYFLFTNGDNLFIAGFFPVVGPWMLNQTTVIGWNYLTHYNTYSLKKPENDFKERQIDLAGAMISRRHLLERFEYPFFMPSLYGWKEADGKFWERAALFADAKMLNESFLLVHQ